MDGRKDRETETKRRKPRSTFDEVVRAAKTVEKRTKRRASEAAVRKQLKGGSSTFICAVLKEWRGSKKFDGIRKGSPSDASVETPKQDHHDGLHPERPEDDESRIPSEGRSGDAAAASKPASGTAVVTLEALTLRVEQSLASLSLQAVDIRLLISEVQELRRRVGTLSAMAVAEPRQGVSAKPEAATTGPRRSTSANGASKPVEVPSPDQADDDPRSRAKIKVAILHCVAKLVEIGSPMNSKQLHRSLPEGTQVGTAEDLYNHLKIRARKGRVMKYAGERSGAFEAGPGAVAFLDKHMQKPMVHLTEGQVARSENEVIFLGALELLEKAGGGPLPVKDFVDALSDGSKEGVRRVKDQLKNCHYRFRKDDRGRGIGRITVYDDGGGTEDGPTHLHVLTRGGKAP